MVHMQLLQQNDVLLCRQGWEVGSGHLGLWGREVGVTLGGGCWGQCSLFLIHTIGVKAPAPLSPGAVPRVK